MVPDAVGGVWAVYPFVLSFSICGITHCVITAILSMSTISYFCLAAFKCAGTPADMLWGSYPTVRKGDLENYTFCHYCSKPKGPGTHHCRSCEKCIVDMDHHCPFVSFRYFLCWKLTICCTLFEYSQHNIHHVCHL